MGKIHGKTFVVFLDNAAGTAVDITTFLDNVDFGDQEVDLAENTTGGQNAKTFSVGHTSGTISITGMFDAATGAIDSLLSDLVGKPAGTFDYRPEGTGLGKVKKTVEAILQKYGTTSPVGGVTKFAASFQMNGDVTRATQ
jgi:hypothetical protein